MPPPVLQDVLLSIPPSLQWPVKICIYTSAACYVLSVITGNVSQVDRIWTFMPALYTAYFALLPLWPKTPPLPLFPYTPEGVYPSVAQNYNPRALLMLLLAVCLLRDVLSMTLVTYAQSSVLVDVQVCTYISISWYHIENLSGYHTIHGEGACLACKLLNDIFHIAA